MDQASGGEDPSKPTKKKSGDDESKNKKLRDRITSFRKQGGKKDKPLIQHPTDPLSPQAELPLPQPFFDERSMNLSEKEIIDLFEKMMEDMNLNEERKAPLRGKDLSTKREMVVQYISATAKSAHTQTHRASLPWQHPEGDIRDVCQTGHEGSCDRTGSAWKPA